MQIEKHIILSFMYTCYLLVRYLMYIYKSILSLFTISDSDYVGCCFFAILSYILTKHGHFSSISFANASWRYMPIGLYHKDDTLKLFICRTHEKNYCVIAIANSKCTNVNFIFFLIIWSANADCHVLKSKSPLWFVLYVYLLYIGIVTIIVIRIIVNEINWSKRECELYHAYTRMY